MITFITSVRHPHNSNGPFRYVLGLLEQTLRSVCRQTHPRFRVLVVANEPFRLSFHDDRIDYVWVNFPPPNTLRQASFGMPDLRIDRGCKYVVGLLAAQAYPTDHIMFVDADDYVSNRLAALSDQFPAENGWLLRDGFVYQRAGNEFGRLAEFHLRCGTSHIIARSLFTLPAGLDPQSSREAILARVPSDYLLRILGSHRWIAAHLAEAGTPLAPLPFAGAVYHIGHGENHTARSGILPIQPVTLTDELRQEFAIPAALFDGLGEVCFPPPAASP
jgi:hypothetical protein